MRVLGKIISFEGFENSYYNFVYDGVHFNEVLILQITVFNSTMDIFHHILFSEYVPNITCVKMNISRKNFEQNPQFYQKRSSRRVLLKKC